MTAVPAFARAWLAQKRDGADAVQSIEDAELRALDERTARAQSEALLSAVRIDSGCEERDSWSGFVEQQRLFMRALR